jgi:hypothetical protein
MEKAMDRVSADVAAEIVRGPLPPEELEEDAIRLLEALESEAKDAIGPAVGCDFDRSVIDVRFCIEAPSSAAVHQKISTVAAIIDGTIKGELRTSMAPTSHLDFAGVC